MVLEAASVDRLFGSWAVDRVDPDSLYTESSVIIGARGEWVYDNDPLAHAIVETLLAGAIGPDGLQHRSLYQADDNAEVSPAELELRRKIDRRVKSGTTGTRFDAGGQLSRADMSRVTMTSTILNGDSWSIRCWKPDRPGRQTHATCWRIVHPSRICNPNDRQDTAEINQGVRRDEDGVPISVFVRSHHPAAVMMGQVRPTWMEVPIWSPDGQLNVTHHCLHRHADQLRPPGWFAPVMQVLRLFGQTLKAKTVADTLKASMGLILECDDPKAAARMDKNGAVLDGRSKIVPGKVYYVKKGTNWKTLDFNYNGSDFAQWTDVILTNLCSPFQVPADFVTQRMTKSNLAASRVALMQAYRTFHGHQNDLIATTESPWDQSLIIEDLARGTFGIGLSGDTETTDRILHSAYLRPPRPMPDPLKEAQASDVWVKRLGKSLSGCYADAGMDFAEQIAQREHDDDDLERRGIVLQGDGTGSATMPPASDAPAPGQDGGSEADPEDSQEDDAEDTTEDQPEDQAEMSSGSFHVERDAFGRVVRIKADNS